MASIEADFIRQYVVPVMPIDQKVDPLAGAPEGWGLQ